MTWCEIVGVLGHVLGAVTTGMPITCDNCVALVLARVSEMLVATLRSVVRTSTAITREPPRTRRTKSQGLTPSIAAVLLRSRS